MTYDETRSIPLPDIRQLIEKHGTLAVGLAYLRAALARRSRPPPFDFQALSPHLRRDIGLPPWDESRHWR